MTTLQGRDVRGLDALRREVALLLLPMSRLALAGGGELGSELGGARCYAEAVTHADTDATRLANGPDGGGFGDSDLATSSEDSEADRTRLIALVELARGGDAEAFGALYDHYQPSVYRFLFYRTRSSVLAEDLTSETFLRALRNMSNFRWQGRDFGAWLMTIARNLATDHFKAGRNRREFVTEDMSAHDAPTEGPESAVLAGLTNEIVLKALTELPDEQRDCLVMRFLQGLSIAETAAILERSEGAVKQLQLRGVRNLAKLMPEGMRDS